MSNLIKYNFVNFADRDKVIIDSEKLQNGEHSHKKKDEKEMNAQETIELESAMNLFTGDLEEEPSIIKAENINEVSEEKISAMLEEELLNAQNDAGRILEDAREQAAMLIRSASEEIDGERQRAREEGYQEGYAAGEIDAREKYDELQMQLNETMLLNQQEYQKMIAEIEPRYGEILIGLLQKITGVMVEQHQDIILYLIRNAIDNLDKSTHYTIRYSTEDAPLIDSKRSELRAQLGEECVIEFLEEKSLKHNECMIETDSQMVDCGLSTQLESLTEAIKMLAL